jgi:hypothetical protein
MFVKQPSGLCPFCRGGRPARPIDAAMVPIEPHAPFAPIVGDTRSWQRIPIGQRLRDFVQRSRRPARATEATSPS